MYEHDTICMNITYPYLYTRKCIIIWIIWYYVWIYIYIYICVYIYIYDYSIYIYRDANGPVKKHGNEDTTMTQAMDGEVISNDGNRMIGLIRTTWCSTTVGKSQWFFWPYLAWATSKKNHFVFAVWYQIMIDYVQYSSICFIQPSPAPSSSSSTSSSSS